MIEAQLKTDTNSVQLRGTYLQGKKHDLPTMIWFSDLIEPSENFKKFFEMEGSKVLDVRNVWLVDYRNMGNSDHHESFAMGVSISYNFLFFRTSLPIS